MAAVKALQQWCKIQCQGYRDVTITNMTTSFRDGMAFCALIHKHRPDLIKFDSLNKENVYDNNHLAFRVAEEELGIPALLDAEDMVALRVPDRLSILTYVSQYYNYFHGRSPIGGLGGIKRPAEMSNEQPAGKKNQPITAKAFPSTPATENQPITAKSYPSSKPANTQREVLAERSNKTDALSSSCNVCKKHVHLVQRHLVDGRLYHRNCFKCSECSNILLSGTYRSGARPGTFICTTHTPNTYTPPTHTPPSIRNTHITPANKHTPSSLTNQNTLSAVTNRDQSSSVGGPVKTGPTPTKGPSWLVGKSDRSSNPIPTRSNPPTARPDTVSVTATPRSNLPTARFEPVTVSLKLPSDRNSNTRSDPITVSVKPPSGHNVNKRSDPITVSVKPPSGHNVNKRSDPITVSVKPSSDRNSTAAAGSSPKPSTAAQRTQQARLRFLEADRVTSTVTVTVPANRPSAAGTVVGTSGSAAGTVVGTSGSAAGTVVGTSGSAAGTVVGTSGSAAGTVVGTSGSAAGTVTVILPAHKSSAAGTAGPAGAGAGTGAGTGRVLLKVGDWAMEEKVKAKAVIAKVMEENNNNNAPMWRPHGLKSSVSPEAKPSGGPSAAGGSLSANHGPARAKGTDPKENDSAPLGWRAMLKPVTKETKSVVTKDPTPPSADVKKAESCSRPWGSGSGNSQASGPAAVLPPGNSSNAVIGPAHPVRLTTELGPGVRNGGMGAWKNGSPSPGTDANKMPKGKPEHIPKDEIMSELQQIEASLNELERRGVDLEKQLRRCEEEGEEDGLMVDWFNLIRNKQLYIRRESELVYVAKTQDLEEQQPSVEAELRRLMDKPDHLKTFVDRRREKELMDKLVEIVNDRSAIVDGLDEDRLREEEEDEQLNMMMQNLDVKKEKTKKSPMSKLFGWKSKKD